MRSRVPWILSSFLAAGLALSLWSQGARIAQLEGQLVGAGAVEAGSVQAQAQVWGGEDQPNENGSPLVVRLQRVEEEVQSLRKKVERRRANKLRGAASALVSGSPRHHGIADIDSHNVIDALDSDDPDIRQRLGSLVRDEMEEQREQRREERREKRRQRMEAMLEELAEQHQFTDSQYQGLSDLISEERDEISELFRAAREDHSFGQARERAQEIREETEAEAQNILNEEQYAAWSAKREEELARYYGRRRR
ncbi:MAG TPA: hypothetical protein DIU15_21155 [Deltaproteobacteria bacterium]|nr:hypothetical protein [Deltaproteobacteria bacterium]HCP48560.1 hypothetical protein [Deltaproteobacteria bacterium]